MNSKPRDVGLGRAGDNKHVRNLINDEDDSRKERKGKESKTQITDWANDQIPNINHCWGGVNI